MEESKKGPHKFEVCVIYSINNTSCIESWLLCSLHRDGQRQGCFVVCTEMERDIVCTEMDKLQKGTRVYTSFR